MDYKPTTDEEILEDLEFLRDLGLVEQTPDGRWRATPWAVEIGSEGWRAVVEAALLKEEQ